MLDTGAPVGDAMVKLDGLDTPVAPGRRSAVAWSSTASKPKWPSASSKPANRPRCSASGVIVGDERAAEVFEAAYDEHAHRLAKLFADVGPNQ